MADPLSVSASIAGLITITDNVFHRAFKYVKAVKGAPNEVSSLALALGALSGILHNLHLVASQLEGEPFDTAIQASHVYSCIQTVEKVEKILDKFQSSSAGSRNTETMKRLKWPFSVSEAKMLCAEIEGHKTALSLALNVDSMAGLLQTLSKQKELHDDVGDIKSQLRIKYEVETKIAVSEERRKALNWIQPYGPHQNHEMSLKLRHPGTGLWLIESDEFKAWLSCPNAKLWCYGIPGAGKTVLASTVIQEALERRSPNTAVAFFYCDYKNTTTQDPRNILGSLACQIALQNEQSFGELHAFYAKHNPSDRPSVGFDLEELRDLLVEMASSFDNAMIVVDALDECGTQSSFVTRLLSSLNNSGEASNIKTLFLSRDEQDIREALEDYSHISIAARSSDLKMFVGAEIEYKIRNKDLRIKDQSLKQQIMKRLVEGADGMFRWVVCQVDHLCLLPNDAARQRALNTLPPTLNATYERILQRINKSNKEVQQLVQRSLRWLVCSKEPLSSSALCEAISIDTGDTTLDRTAIPEESEILRWCSSLVRRSASGKSLELGHFTVKEFLTTGTHPLDSEYGVYHFSPEIDDAELAETCLTYLSLEDFGSGSPDSNHFSYKRWENFGFRQYAVRHWAEHARKNLTRPEVMSLAQQLLHPSKPLAFVSWTQDLLWAFYGYRHGIFQNNRRLPKYDLATTTPLHFAAMLALPESCEWLLQKGCYVDQASTYGTPLECALLGQSVMERWTLPKPSAELMVSRRSTVKLIIESGADVQRCSPSRGSFTYIALALRDEVVCTELLRKGAAIDRKSALLLASEDGGSLLAYEILKNTGRDVIRPEDHASLLEAALKSKELIKNSHEMLVHRSGDPIAAHTDYMSPFLTAAEYGQLSALKQLLYDHKLSVDTRCRQDRRSALHLAASNDHIDIVRFLQEHGADCTLADSQGRTPLHASVESSSGYLCLQFLLDQNVNIDSTDKNGLTAWHLAASQGNIHALVILKTFAAPRKKFNPLLKASDGRTTLHCAAQSGSKETLIFLLNHCDEDAVHSKSLDGSTALHYAMKAYSLNPDGSNGSGLGALDALLAHGANPTSQDSLDNTALTYLVETWGMYFPKHRDINFGDEYKVAEIAAMISKILDSIKNRDCLMSVCTDPHLLFLALVFGKEDLAYKVLEYCPSVDKKAYRICTLSSLEAACYYGGCSRQLLEEVLRRSKVDRSAASTKSGLLLCACQGRPYQMERTVKDLLDLGFNPNDCSVEGRTAMMSAAKGGYVAIVEVLIHHGADVAAIDNNGWSVIHYACQSGSERLLYSLKRIISNWNARITTRLHDEWSHDATALHLAASLDNYALEFLLKNDLISDINSLTHNKETALWMAASFGISRNVSLLLDSNADDTIQAWIESPLHVAVRYGFLELVNIFINKGCDLLLQDGSGLTPELLARKYGHHYIASVLKDKTSSRASRHTMIMEKNQSASEPLKLAIELGDVNLCQALMEEGVNTDSGFSDYGGDTPVLYAFARGQFEVAEYLILNGASIAGAEGDMSIFRGYTPFHYAATAGKVQILRILFEKAPQGIMRCCQPVHPIHLAIASGRAECVELIINHAREVKEIMLLDHVCGGTYDLNHVVNVSVLGADFLWPWRLTSTLDFSQRGLDTAKPLHIAASLGHADIARSLIEHGASVDSVNDRLRTPLHFAADQGQIQLAEILIHANVNVNAADDNLQSPCMVAASAGSLKSIQVLIQGGADLTLKDRKCHTALHRAAFSGHLDIVSFLVTNMEEYALNAETLSGESVLSAISRWTYPSHSSFFLNLAPKPSIYEPHKSNVLTAVARTNVAAHLKKVLRRLPKELIPRLLAHRAIDWGTPLYAAATRPAEKVIDMLLDAGADLELEGGEHGTSLMGACATGRLGVVRILVGKGAKTSYTKDDRVFSVLLAAKHHVKVIRWLLVGRFMEGPLLIKTGETE